MPPTSYHFGLRAYFEPKTLMMEIVDPCADMFNQKVF